MLLSEVEETGGRKMGGRTSAWTCCVRDPLDVSNWSFEEAAGSVCMEPSRGQGSSAGAWGAFTDLRWGVILEGGSAQTSGPKPQTQTLCLSNLQTQQQKVATTRPESQIQPFTLFYPARHLVSTRRQCQAPCP